MTDARPRIVELDALRGLAALAVVVFHYTTKYDELYGRAAPLPLDFTWGQHGVDFFFMLSGYVIFLTLDRSSSALDFVARRGMRLYPVFWAAVALTFLVVRMAGLPGQEVTWGEAIVNLTMLPGLLDVRPVDGVYWSLQTELFFYATLLALHRAGLLRRLSLTLGIWLAVAAAAQATVVICGGESVVAGLVRKMQTVLSLDYIHDFALGMLLYRCHQNGKVTSPACAVALGCIAFRVAFDGIWPGLIVVLLTATLALAVLGKLPWLQARWLVFLGTISYSLYLVHQNIGYIVLHQADQAGVAPLRGIAAAMALSICLATGLTWLVERPVLRYLTALRRREAPILSPAGDPRGGLLDQTGHRVMGR